MSIVRPAVLVSASMALVLSTTPLAHARSVTPLALPHPDHVVVVMMENHSYDDILGATGRAPYLQSLAANGASFTNSFAITHPSQPNYLAIYSGSTQGVTNDHCPQSFSTTNLYKVLHKVGAGFAGYSEDLPEQGSMVCTAGAYARKHVPWTDFANNPGSINEPLTAMPADYSSLPSVSFVIPNLNDDMHDGSVAQGDAWVQAHLSDYATWAGSHNSMLIVTFDEDDHSENNQIPTIFYGAHVKTGAYGTQINHYSVLRTITQMFRAGHPGESAAAAPIKGCWD
jgi:acid phosphatase